MSNDKAPIGLEDLSAYLDGELDIDRRATVERHLVDEPGAAARLAEYCRRDEALRIGFVPIGDESEIPGIIRTQSIRAAKIRRRWTVAAAAIACVAIFTVTWWLHIEQGMEDRALSTLAHESVTAHLLYLSDSGGAPDVTGDREHLSARLSALLGRDVKVPDLAALGFQLAGTRELAAEGGPAVLVVYRDVGGQEVSCYFKRLSGSQETGLKHKESAGVRVLYRLDEQLGYAVVGSLPSDALQRIAETVYRTNPNTNQD